MIVITGAAGKTGQAVIKSLVSRGEKVRGIMHRSEQKQLLLEIGAQEALVADMGDRRMMDAAFQGAAAIYHICPNMHPQELLLGAGIVEAAYKAKIDHFVYHSVLHPQVEAMPHHWQKMRVEEMLFESGLPYTILQPAAYMQNVLAYWPGIMEKGSFTLPYAPATRINMVDLRDVAEAAAVVLTEEGHDWAIYELCGPHNHSQGEAAAIISRQLGREVAAKAMPIQVWEQGARSSGLGEYALHTLISMFQYYEQYGFYGNSRVLSGLLGRPPREFAQFINEFIANRELNERR